MASNVNDLIDDEISFLEDEIHRLEFELTRDRHSTPVVERHVSRGQLADHMPRQNVSRSQLADHMPRQSAITGLNEYQTAIQSERANRLADHGGLASHLAGQRNMANQDEHRYEMTRQHQHGHTPNIHSHRHVARNNENMITDDMQRDRTQNVELPHKADQKRNFIKPATFDGSTNWSDFKSHFEVCAELNCWSMIEKGMYLAVSLRGNAQGVLGNLPSNDQRTYDALCTALQQRFAPTNQTELYRAQLRERKQKAVESLPELGQDVRRLTNLAYPTATVDLKEILAKEQFIDALRDPDMRLRIKQARPVDLNDAVRHAVELQAFQSADKKMQESQGYVRAAEKDISEVKESNTEKVLKDITDALSLLKKDVKSLKERQDGHFSSQPSLDKREQNATQNRTFKCYFCGRPGHMKNKCRDFLASQAGQKRRQKHGRQPSEMSCTDSKEQPQGNLTQLNCGASEAINKAGESGIFIEVGLYDKQLRFLVDTGATVTIVSKCMIADVLSDKPLSKLSTDILIADGTPLKVYGTQEVQFSIQGMLFDHTIVVADLNVDGILGLDFLRLNKCAVDLEKCTLKFGQVEKAVACQYRGKIGCFRVSLCENLGIPDRKSVV